MRPVTTTIRSNDLKELRTSIVNLINSYIVIIFCFLYLVIYAWVYEDFLYLNDSLKTFNVNPILFICVSLLIIAPICSFLIKDEKHAKVTAEITLYAIGAFSLGLLTWLVLSTGGVFGSYISWVYRYIFVLSLQLRVFSVIKFSWRAPLTTFFMIIFLCVFVEIQINYVIDNPTQIITIAETKNTFSKELYFLDWIQYMATFVGIMVNQVAIDTARKYDFGGQLLHMVRSLQKRVANRG